MKKTFLIPILVIAAFFVFSPSANASTQTLTPDQEVKMMNLSIPWVENRGQISDLSVRFSANTLLGTVFITKNGSITYSLQSVIPTGDKVSAAVLGPEAIRPEWEESLNPALSDPSRLLGMTREKEQKTQSVVIREVPLYKLTPVITGEEPSPTKTNYFIGNDQSKWQSNVSTYNLVSEGYIYPKIKLELKAHNNNVEKIYTVYPNGNPKDIRMKVEGVSKLEITANGDLEVTPSCTPGARVANSSTSGDSVASSQNDCGVDPIYFTAPVAYQNINGKKVTVSVKYKLTDPLPLAKGVRPEGGRDLTYSFELGKYNLKYPLIIDPSLNYLVASTYLGGSGWDDGGNAVVIDSLGNLYLAGNTGSTNFPTTAGVASSTFGGGSNDACVFKLSNDLATLFASTYLGGSDYDIGTGIVLDSLGNVYAIGQTASTDFPVTGGAASTTKRGGRDAFISKLTSDLTTLSASTYLGGSGHDSAGSLIIGSSGDIYVIGYTASTNFPITTGAVSSTYGGGANDVFITKLPSDLSTFSASTYFGGTGGDIGGNSVRDSLDNIYFTGYTSSADLPTTPGAASTTYGGGSADAFVVKLTGDLTTISTATYLGGTGTDYGGVLALDGLNNIYIIGQTASTNFTTTPGAASTTYGGGSYDVFVAKLGSTSTTLSIATYLGGTGSDEGQALALDSSGNVYIAGYTASTDFPVTAGAASNSYGGSVDAFVAKLNGNLTAIFAATYLGGTGADYGWRMAIDSSDNVYLSGFTASTDFPVTTGAYQRTYGGGFDAFFAKFGSYLPSVTSVSPNEVIQNADATTLTITGTNFASGASVKFDGTALITTFVSSTILTATLPTSLVSTAGVRNVTVYNPLDDGGTSGNAEFKINSVGVSRPPVATPTVTPTETPTTPAVTPVTPPVTPPTTITVVPAIDPNTQGTYSPASAKEATPSLAVNLNIIPATVNTVCTPDTLIKSNSSPSVYYCGEDGLRYVFANESVYFTWFKDFADIKILTDAELAQISLGHKLITHRPGIKMVKIQTDPKVYAVARGGVLRWIKNEAMAKLLYGDAWNTQILDVSDALFVNYTVGEPIN